MTKRHSRVHGVTQTRKKLRRMPHEIQREVQDVLRDGANRIQRDAMSMAPVDQGDLRESIEVKLARDRLTAIIGPGASATEIVRRKTGSVLGGKKVTLRKRNAHQYFQFFKALWAEFGTKGAPARNIPPQPARPFMRPAYELTRRWLRPRLNQGVDKALERAARG